MGETILFAPNRYIYIYVPIILTYFKFHNSNPEKAEFEQLPFEDPGGSGLD